MKITDEMVKAAIDVFRQPNDAGLGVVMRAAIEAAIEAYVKPTRSESAKARWANMDARDRVNHAKRMAKGRWPGKGLDASA